MAQRADYPQCFVTFNVRLTNIKDNDDIITKGFNTAGGTLITPIHCAVNLNGFKSADTFSLDIDFAAFPYPPQIIDSCEVTVYMFNAKEEDSKLMYYRKSNYTNNTSNPGAYSVIQNRAPIIRGLCDKIELDVSGKESVIKMSGRDYTCLLLDHKFPSYKKESRPDSSGRLKLKKNAAGKYEFYPTTLPTDTLLVDCICSLIKQCGIDAVPDYNNYDIEKPFKIVIGPRTDIPIMEFTEEQILREQKLDVGKLNISKLTTDPTRYRTRDVKGAKKNRKTKGSWKGQTYWDMICDLCALNAVTPKITSNVLNLYCTYTMYKNRSAELFVCGENVSSINVDKKYNKVQIPSYKLVSFDTKDKKFITVVFPDNSESTKIKEYNTVLNNNVSSIIIIPMPNNLVEKRLKEIAKMFYAEAGKYQSELNLTINGLSWNGKISNGAESLPIKIEDYCQLLFPGAYVKLDFWDSIQKVYSMIRVDGTSQWKNRKVAEGLSKESVDKLYKTMVDILDVEPRKYVKEAKYTYSIDKGIQIDINCINVVNVINDVTSSK